MVQETNAQTTECPRPHGKKTKAYCCAQGHLHSQGKTRRTQDAQTEHKMHRHTHKNARTQINKTHRRKNTHACWVILEGRIKRPKRQKTTNKKTTEKKK